uniref:non-specific serine/threonine protein kinase n=1 Tax=Ananas comosus var. bracteatus TaxID=296719 RepID=A0A6V7P146_ANACO|nr:unnamed protein product [Ananas comosus var. bracteatus]
MSDSDLSRRTVIFGLRLWVVIGILAGAAFVLLLFLLSLYFTSKRRPRPTTTTTTTTSSSAVAAAPRRPSLLPPPPRPPNPPTKPSPTPSRNTPRPLPLFPSPSPSSSSAAAGGGAAAAAAAAASSSATAAAARAAEPFVAGQRRPRRPGGVALGVGPLGPSGEGIQGRSGSNWACSAQEFSEIVRMLVYEYVDNGNLEQWLHGDVGPTSPLTWDIRMNIILGTAKGLMYLHEGLEPKVVHRDVKSSNILLDKQWNPKLSDFGLAKLLGSERSYVTTRVMGTFGYVAPEYAGTGMLNETSDIYSFGILIMEIISGRIPVDYNRPPGEVNLVEWLKIMVSNRNSEGVLDQKMPEKPSSRALKKALLVALRCVDPDSQKRPKIGHVIHMLEVDDFPYRDERRTARVPGQPRLSEKPANEADDKTEN